MENVKVGKALRLKRAKRVVQTMIDQLLSAEANLLGLTNLRCHDEYTYNHSVNVGILSIAIGTYLLRASMFLVVGRRAVSDPAGFANAGVVR